MAALTAHEQYMLELINRARLDPAGEAARYGIDLNQGLAAGTISTASKQPLAPNQYLATAAQNHSQWMLDTDTFSHTGAGGTNPGTRMTNAGYVFSGSWAWGENIAWWGTTGTLNLTNAVNAEHEGLFESAGHRRNMLNDTFQEIGVGIRTGNFQGYNAAMTTEDYAKSGTGQFLTGVTFKDANGDKFYTPGEGLAGVTISAKLSGGATTTATSAAAGGYGVKLASGSYDVTLSGGGIAAPLGVTLALAAKNVKLDLIALDAVAVSASAILGANVKGLTLLGTENLNGTGNGLANTIVGNKGVNQLNGAAGADTLTGGAGNDLFIVKAGEANGDTILDFTGNGTAAGDVIQFQGYGTSATLQLISGNQYRVSGNGFSETITINGAVNASDYSFSGGTTPPPPPVPTDPVTGTAGNDSLSGNSLANTIGGGAGNDTINGNGGSDRLYGGDGLDTLNGGSGNDSLYGGAGADRLTGSTGADRYFLRNMAEAGDTITDFNKAGGDRLELTQLFDDLGYAGTAHVADGYIRAVQSGANVLVQIDGNGGANSFVTLATLSNVTLAALGTDYFIG